MHLLLIEHIWGVVVGKLVINMEFRNSTSLFREKERAALKIQFQDVNTPDVIFNAAHINVPIYDGLQSLELPGFNDGSILANPNDGLNFVQRKFLTKLRFVLINNHPDSMASRCEEYVRDLAVHLCDCAGLDDGMNLVLLPCNLRKSVKRVLQQLPIRKVVVDVS